MKYSEDVEVFNRILVPLDGSEFSERALETAINVAKKFGGNITLLHVYLVSVIMSLSTYNEAGIVASVEAPTLIKAIREAGADILVKAEKVAEAEGIPVETQLKEGHVAQEIIKAAREGRYDLIVMGAKGRSKIKELLLGSVSEKVVRTAPCTVMVVK
jgi:nucleotide-binding universal stress UspA family protein